MEKEKKNTDKSGGRKDIEFMLASVAEICAVKGLNLKIAESFTGGRLSSLITQRAGASVYFKEGIVCYSNKSKEERLSVKAQTISANGAVSLPCAKEMLNGLIKDCDSDVAVVTTGNAGPTAEKKDERGVCYIGAAVKGRLVIYMCRFTGSRKTVIEKGAKKAVTVLFGLLQNL